MTTKRISKVTIKRMVDTDPDTSYLGEYSNRAKTDYAIDRKHTEDCQSLEANHRAGVDLLERVIAHLENVKTGEPASKDEYGVPTTTVLWEGCNDAQDLLIDAQDELQECDCGERGDMERNEYRYFNGYVENYKGETEENIRKYIRQDYERMERLLHGDWCYIGIRAGAEIVIDGGCQTISSGGLWGVESDSDRAYLATIEDEEIGELRKQLTAVGFSKRAIALACKNIERTEN